MQVQGFQYLADLLAVIGVVVSFLLGVSAGLKR
jgi:hypothetical protein